MCQVDIINSSLLSQLALFRFFHLLTHIFVYSVLAWLSFLFLNLVAVSGSYSLTISSSGTVYIRYPHNYFPIFFTSLPKHRLSRAPLIHQKCHSLWSSSPISFFFLSPFTLFYTDAYFYLSFSSLVYYLHRPFSLESKHHKGSYLYLFC